MSEPINDGGPAFPMSYTDCGNSGMSLRDWFAGQALEKASRGGTKSAEEIAKRAYYISDAMIKEKNKTK